MDEVQNRVADARPQAGRGQVASTPGRLPLWRRRPVIVLGTLLLGVGVFFGLQYLAESWTHESTDDAFLDANFVALAPKVGGQVKKVYVEDNQPVKAGDLLVEIDPRDFQIALDQKKAAVESAQQNGELIKATVELFRSQIASAEATAKQSAAEAAASAATAQRAQSDLKRAQELMQNHTISAQEFDTAQATATAAEANLRAAQEKASSDQSKVTQAQAQLQAGIKGFDRAAAQTRQSEWEAKAAELNLSYTRVVAPQDGRVTRKAVQDGDYVQVGQRLMALVPNQVFVTANFKETQLTHIRTNQPVRITVDAVDGRTFRGHVDSIQAGSGARFSLLPPENAVGNYVKVVQRVPVKILFDEPLNVGHVLGPGMSVVPSVQVADFTLPEIALLAATAVVTLGLGLLWWILARRKAAE